MVAHDQLGADRDRLLDHGVGDVDGEEHVVDLGAGVADGEPDPVPVLGEGWG